MGAWWWWWWREGGGQGEGDGGGRGDRYRTALWVQSSGCGGAVSFNVARKRPLIRLGVMAGSVVLIQGWSGSAGVRWRVVSAQAVGYSWSADVSTEENALSGL